MPLTYELAGIGSRALAAVVDLLIIVAAFIAILLATGALANFAGGDVAIIFVLTAVNVLFWGYYIFFETVWQGQSPGKRQMGLRVVTMSGTTVTFMDCLVRNIVRLVDFLPSFYGIGIVVMFISPLSQRLGDFAAGTIVIREKTSVSLLELTRGLSYSRLVFPDESKWDIPALGVETERVVRAYLDSADRIRPVSMRENRARRLAEWVASLIGATSFEPPEPFLARVNVLAEGIPMNREQAASSVRHAAWDTRQISAEDERLIKEFLSRAPDLHGAARARIASQMAERIATAVGASPPSEPEAFLREVLMVRQGA